MPLAAPHPPALQRPVGTLRETAAGGPASALHQPGSGRLREEEGKDQGGAGEGPASLPLGVSLFVHGLLPICLCSHLRGHLGNQMKCQAQGRASEQPRQSSASSDLAGESGSLQTNRWAHVASHASPSLSSAHRLSVDLEREERKRPSQKPWASFFLSLSFSFTRSHTHTHTSVGRGPRVKRLLWGAQQCQPLLHPALTEPLQELPPPEARPDSPSERPAGPGAWGPGTLRYCCPCLRPRSPLATARGLSRRGEPGSRGISVRGKDKGGKAASGDRKPRTRRN